MTRSQEAELEKLRAQMEEIKEGHKLTETTKIQSLETVVERVTFEKQFKVKVMNIGTTIKQVFFISPWLLYGIISNPSSMHPSSHRKASWSYG